MIINYLNKSFNKEHSILLAIIIKTFSNLILLNIEKYATLQLVMIINIIGGGIYMKKISIIYWSGTGNTEKMAELISEGAVSSDTKVNLLNVSSATIEDVTGADVIALGCSAMGDEVLEEGEMEPFVESIQDKLSGKNVALFGSYGWGDGQWMRDWKERMENSNAILINDGLMVNGEPDGEGIKECKELGKKLASL